MIDFNSGGLHEKILVSPIFIKALTMNREIYEIVERMNLSGKSVYVWQLLELAFETIILCHVVGCLYQFLANIEIYFGMEQTWLHQQNLIDVHWYEQYMASFYWSLATIMLVGSGGTTFYETIFVCVTLCATVGVFASILGNIQMILEDIAKKTKDYRKDTEILNQLFETNSNIHIETQAKLLNYLKYLYIGHKDMSASQEISSVLSKFPQNLQKQVRLERYKYLIHKFEFIKQNFTPEGIEDIINIVQEEYYMPNQVIIQQGEQNVFEEPKLYLIMKGAINIEQDNLINQKKQKFLPENIVNQQNNNLNNSDLQNDINKHLSIINDNNQNNQQSKFSKFNSANQQIGFQQRKTFNKQQTKNLDKEQKHKQQDENNQENDLQQIFERLQANLDNNQFTQLQILNQGMYFGEYPFFCNTVSPYQVRSTDFTTLLTIKRSDLLKILGKQDNEIFHQIQHQLRNSWSSYYLKKICYKCGQLTHLIQTCNILHYEPNRQNLFAKHNYYQPVTEREKIKRHNKKRSCIHYKQVVHEQTKSAIEKLFISKITYPAIRNLQRILKHERKEMRKNTYMKLALIKTQQNMLQEYSEQQDQDEISYTSTSSSSDSSNDSYYSQNSDEHSYCSHSNRSPVFEKLSIFQKNIQQDTIEETQSSNKKEQKEGKTFKTFLNNLKQKKDQNPLQNSSDHKKNKTNLNIRKLKSIVKSQQKIQNGARQNNRHKNTTIKQHQKESNKIRSEDYQLYLQQKQQQHNQLLYQKFNTAPLQNTDMLHNLSDNHNNKINKSILNNHSFKQNSIKKQQNNSSNSYNNTKLSEVNEVSQFTDQNLNQKQVHIQTPNSQQNELLTENSYTDIEQYNQSLKNVSNISRQVPIISIYQKNQLQNNNNLQQKQQQNFLNYSNFYPSQQEEQEQDNQLQHQKKSSFISQNGQLPTSRSNKSQDQNQQQNKKLNFNINIGSQGTQNSQKYNTSSSYNEQIMQHFVKGVMYDEEQNEIEDLEQQMLILKKNFFYEFEKIQQYDHFFPMNNLNNIVIKYNKILKKKKEKLKKNTGIKNNKMTKLLGIEIVQQQQQNK